MQCRHYKMSQIIEHTGIVKHINGHQIQVLIVQESACSSCHANGACSSADKDDKLIDVESTDNTLKVGDHVMLYGQSSMGLLAVLLAFVIPFTLILLSLFIFRRYTENEALSGTLSLSVLVPYYIVLSFFNTKMKSKFQFTLKKDSF